MIYETYAETLSEVEKLINQMNMEELKQLLKKLKENKLKMVTTIKFAKVRDTAIIPSKDLENMGYDIYANFDEDYMIINSHETKMIPTGIASACDTDYAFVLKERGSTGTKGIAQRCGVIDSGYRNEWFVPLFNTNNFPIVIAKKGITLKDSLGGIGINEALIYPYEKAIAQAILLPVPETDVEEYTYEELKAIPSKRGMGALGSSNK